jgi:hypothetical protein
MSITLETPYSCDYKSMRLGAPTSISNRGAAGAGPFVVEVNGAQKEVPSGLPAGQGTSVWFPEYVYFGLNYAHADAGCQIAESDEENSLEVTPMLPIPTLPPTCTPLPSAPPPAVPEAATAILVLGAFGGPAGYAALQWRARH